MARREVPKLDATHNTVIRNPNQSPNNDVFSFLSRHQPPQCCSATSINGDGKGAPAADLAAVKLVNVGAAKGQEEMAVPATTTNVATNATPGTPPASAVAAATADNAAADEDSNDDNDNGVDLDALCHRVRDLRRMLDASANRLADIKADTAIARFKCSWTLELAERRARERICQVKEKLRRLRIKAKRFRVGWTRLHAAVSGWGRKRRAGGGVGVIVGGGSGGGLGRRCPPDLSGEQRYGLTGFSDGRKA